MSKTEQHESIVTGLMEDCMNMGEMQRVRDSYESQWEVGLLDEYTWHRVRQIIDDSMFQYDQDMKMIKEQYDMEIRH